MMPFYTLFGRTFPVYGTMAVTGGLAGFAPVLFLCRRKGCEFENALYLYAMAVVGGIIGAKAVYLMTVLPELVTAFSWRFFLGGMSLTGMLAGAVLSFLYWQKAFRLPKAPYAELLSVSLPCVTFFLRLGCICAGCCYGKETDSVFHVVFSHSPFAPSGVKLFPAQWVEAAFHLAWFIALMILSVRGSGAKDGIPWYLAAYGVLRFLIDFVRGDRGRVFGFGLTLAQLAALALTLFVCVTVFADRSRNGKFLTDSGI